MLFALSDPVLIAIIGIPAGAGAAISTWLSNRAKGRVDVMQAGVGAMRDMIKILQDDNNDLRTRATENDRQRFEMQVQITTLTGQVNRCEADKAELKLEVGELRNRINEQGIA
jgi:peptidoglycan hydrolase CwlO-like protein